METEDIKKLALSIDGDIFFDQSIKNLNWFNIGGKTKIFFKPNSLKSLIEYLKQYALRGKIFILGNGSNVLFDDDIYNGTIIKLGKSFSNITLLDKEMIRNVDPEVLGAHMLVGAFFTKMRKPIFDKQNPYLENFPAKVELLRNFGIDATVLEANNRYFTAKNMLAGAQSGSLTNEKISRIYDIIYDPINMSEQKSRKNIGKEIGFDINNPEYNIVRQSKELADIRRFNQKVKEGEPENLIELNQLTKTQADKIKEQLENLIICGIYEIHKFISCI